MWPMQYLPPSTGIDYLRYGRSKLSADGADMRTHLGDSTYPYSPY